MTRIQFCKIMFMINTAFWFAVAVLYSFGEHDLPRHLIIGVLLFLDAALYFGAYIVVVRKWWLGVFLAMLLTLGNAILSLADQQGILDSVGMILSLLALTSLLMIRKDFQEIIRK